MNQTIPADITTDSQRLATPRISVVIPAYNAEKTLAATLDSVLAQTFAPLEIIVVDDGSRDRTADLVKDYAPLVTLYTQTNAGPSAARNHGVRRAQGDWIALLDSDDGWLPEKLERQAKELTEGVALVHSYTRQDRYRTDKTLDFDVLWGHNYIGTSTVVFNKKLFQEIGGFVEDRSFIGAEDYNMWLRLAGTGQRLVTVREELTTYTPAENSLSQQTAKVVRAELLNMEIIADEFKVDEARLREKRVALLDEYAHSLFWSRDLRLARVYFAKRIVAKPSLKTFGYWLATHLPVSILNLPRRMASLKASPSSTVRDHNSEVAR